MGLFEPHMWVGGIWLRLYLILTPEVLERDGLVLCIVSFSNKYVV